MGRMTTRDYEAAHRCVNLDSINQLIGRYRSSAPFTTLFTRSALIRALNSRTSLRTESRT
ncbi:hypothetical protein PSP6_200016 [Paraburkholderia tropica]|nr:hypothetical protein PSP6_200016 [Paraburkholderia tropica]